MKQLTKVFWMLLCFTISQSGIANEPKKISNGNNQLVESGQLVTKFYVLGSGSIERIVQNIYKDVLSDRNKKITLFYKDKININQAKTIRNQLIIKGIKNSQIQVIEKKQAIYPLYAEVEYILPHKCQYGIAEQGAIYKEYVPCAINYNSIISSKF